MRPDFVPSAWRPLRRSPAFSATLIGALSLGIGATAAMFTVVDAVLIRPLPYPDPGRMVQLRGSTPEGDYNPTSIPRFEAYRALRGVLQDVTAYDWNGGSGVNLGSGDGLEQVRGEHVSQAYFRLFGARMALGRTFAESEDRPGGGRVTVISGGLWQRRFGAEPHLAGKSILLGGEPYTVVGVTGTEFHPDPPADLWLPLQADPDTTDQAFYVYCAARLAPGVTLHQAQAALHAASDAFRRKYPGARNPKSTFTAQLLRDNVTGDVRPALLVLLGAVACLLLTACANAASLLLARAMERAREMAIRTALGATRGQIVRQLLAESLLLALIGGGVGLLFGWMALRALLAASAGAIPLVAAANVLDARVLAFTLAVTLSTGILFGLVPALDASRTDLMGTIKRRRHRGRGAMAMAEMALAVMLLTGAGLLLRTFDALQRENRGFDGRNVVTMETALHGAQFASAGAVMDVVRKAEDRIRAIPGVQAVAVMPSVPLEASIGMTYNIDSRPPGSGLYHGGADWRPVTPEYFDVFRIPIERGRRLTAQDITGAAPVVVISRSMARRQWPNEDPVGRAISVYGGADNLNSLHCRIVGVAGDVHQDGLREEAGDVIYAPLAQLNDPQMAVMLRISPLSWAVRTRGTPLALSQAVGAELRRTAGLPAAQVRDMDRVAAQSLARDRFHALLMTAFAAAAILLAGTGIYGLMRFSMQQRTLEFGIRMALGADGPRLRRMMVREAMTLATAGGAAGLAASLAATRLMSSLLFGVAPRDPAVFVSVPVILGAVALLAAWLPARRAARLEPLEALRHE